MFHLNTEQLIDYWRERRGAAPVARRSAIDPTHVLNLMPQLFMLGREGPGQYQFRLVVAISSAKCMIAEPAPDGFPQAFGCRTIAFRCRWPWRRCAGAASRW